MQDNNQIIQEEKIIAGTVVFVKKKLQNDYSGHDWGHIYRVWKMAFYLAEMENANSFEVQLAALMHDLDDWKLNEKSDGSDLNIVKDWLKLKEVKAPTELHVCKIIEELSFKGAGIETPMSSIEGKVVQDADRLDAIGAIGIARAFVYGGSKKREMHNPEIKPVMHRSFDEYKRNQSTIINHFYEKLLLLKDLMNTDTAKRIANERHKFLEKFLEQFDSEWNWKR
jgi:uncharacterized protein